MAIYDLIPYKIRVLAHPGHFDAPQKTIPLDIEGTCIQVDTRGSRYQDKQFKNGKILEMIFGEEGDLDIWVRWDNDTKAHMYPGSMLHRSSNATMCVSIWKPYPTQGLQHDNRHYSELHPQIWQPRKSYGLFGTSYFTSPNTIDTNTTNTTTANWVSVREGREKRLTQHGHKPTLFINTDAVPMGHPNAIIKDGQRLIRIQKYPDANGNIKINTAIVSSKPRTPKEAKDQTELIMSMTKSAYKAQRKAKKPSAPTRAHWGIDAEDQIDMPSGTGRKITQRKRPYATYTELNYPVLKDSVVEPHTIAPVAVPRPPKRGRSGRPVTREGFLDDMKTKERKITSSPFNSPATKWATYEDISKTIEIDEVIEEPLPYSKVKKTKGAGIFDDF